MFLHPRPAFEAHTKQATFETEVKDFRAALTASLNRIRAIPILKKTMNTAQNKKKEYKDTDGWKAGDARFGWTDLQTPNF